MDFKQLNRALDDYNGRYADEQNLTVKSRKNRRLFTTRLARYFKETTFDLNGCRGFLDKIRETNSPASMADYVKDLRAFVNFCASYEYLDKSFSSKIPMPKVEVRLFNLITEEQAKLAILAGTEPNHNDNKLAQKFKQEARIGLLFILFSGLRNSEMRNLKVDDFNINEKIYKVKSKGGKIELANIPLNMIEPLREWIEKKKSGIMFEVREDSLRVALHRGCDKLKLPRQRVHDLRHIFSLTRLRRREPIQLVSRALRHKKLTTTDKYYSQFLITDIATTTNNSAEIQKEVTPELILDNIEQLIKNFGITQDKRFKFIRTNGQIIIQTV